MGSRGSTCARSATCACARSPARRARRRSSSLPTASGSRFAGAGTLSKVPVEGGTPLQVTPLTGLYEGGRWSPSHTILYLRQLAHVRGARGRRPAADSCRRRNRRAPTSTEAQPLPLERREARLLHEFAGGGRGHRQDRDRLARDGEERIFDLPGVAPLGVVDGQLIYATAGGVIMAVPFDREEGRA